jgi:hypothetical protein
VTRSGGWIEDDWQDHQAEFERPQARGEAWSSRGGDDIYPEIVRPIGFMRFKPRVRVRAWTMPIIPKDRA